jgi:glycosyltransferase involved in cell wall biosynthesis
LNEDLVSVIIPTKNSAETIELCLKSIKDQTYPAIEIIVVDNYSDDGTADIARKYARVFQKGPERSTQRNHGVENANGKYVVIIDSDMELTPNVIKECVQEISKQDVAAVIIPEISVGEGFWTNCKALERSCYIGDDTIEAARVFDKKIFQRMGGYDEDIAGGGEDWDLPQRVKKAGYVTGRIESLIKHHEGRLSLTRTMKKKYYYAKTIRKYIKKHPDMANKQITLIRPAYVRHWRRLARDPVHTTGFIFMKCCELMAGGAGVMLNEVRR